VQIYTLHSATAYNASAALLDGSSIPAINHPLVIIWFTPAGSYDGTANLEISPNDTTWFAIDGAAVDDLATPTSAIASPAATKLYRVQVPSLCSLRVRMSGGTQGSLSVFARQAQGIL
jgi:hypothetical protein